MNKTLFSNRHKRRGKRGAVIVEGTLGILMTIVGLMLSLVFIVNVCMLAIFKQKVGMVANEAAMQASLLFPGAFHSGQSKKTKTAKTEEIQALVSERLAALGLPPASEFAVTTDSTGFRTVTVSFTVKAQGLFLQFNHFFAGEIKLKERACAIIPNRMPPAIFTLQLARQVAFGGLRYSQMPSYGRFNNKTNLPAIPGAGGAAAAQPPAPTSLPVGVAGFRRFETMPTMASYAGLPPAPGASAFVVNHP